MELTAYEVIWKSDQEKVLLGRFESIVDARACAQPYREVGEFVIVVPVAEGETTL